MVIDLLHSLHHTAFCAVRLYIVVSLDRSFQQVTNIPEELLYLLTQGPIHRFDIPHQLHNPAVSQDAFHRVGD